MPVQSARQAVCVTMLGKQTWLGLVPGSKKGNNNRAWKKTPPNRDLALAGMMSSGKCEPGLILLNGGAAGEPCSGQGGCEKGSGGCGRRLCEPDRNSHAHGGPAGGAGEGDP